jgi:NitT/TauT family transport system substrate-binding protein
MRTTYTRRRFLTTASLAGAASLLVARRSLAGERPLETTTARIEKTSGICIAPQYVAEELLRAEGFTDIRYVEQPPGRFQSRDGDFTLNYASNFISAIDGGEPITLLAGVMVGCFELFGHERVHSIGDLKGKSIGVQALGSNNHALLTLMAAQVGLDPVTDIHWVADPSVKPISRYVEGKIDAFLAFPPEPQELRARRIGHVIVNTAVDRPWSQYFCCLLGGGWEYVRKYPVATKRVVRAVLTATDLCANEPERAARKLVDGGYTPRYDYALQTLKENGYDKWREYDAEDTVRFYALRLREAGFIRSSPRRSSRRTPIGDPRRAQTRAEGVNATQEACR